MNTHPPHLPPKASSLTQRYARLTFPWLLLCLGCAAVIATAVSTAFLAWYVPDFVSYYVPAMTTESRGTYAGEGIDPFLSKQIDDRSVALYRLTEGSTTVAADAFLAHAVLLSSDGWIVAYLPHAVTIDVAMALDATGVLHTIDQRVYDEDTGLTYFKLAPGNFVVAALESWQSSLLGSAVWGQSQYDWKRIVLSERVSLQDGGRTIDLATPYSRLHTDAEVGTVVYSDRGALVGFVSEDNLLIPSWEVRETLGTLLATGTIGRTEWPLAGTVLDAYLDPVSMSYVRSPAIAVTTASDQSVSGLLVGDIITEVQGMTVDVHSLARQLRLEAPLTVRVIRDGGYQLVEVSR